jgi:nucleoside-diphosphate kinase
MEQTLLIIKPDGMQRGLAGAVLERFERRGLRLSAARLLAISPQLADQHYAEHLEKPFYPALKAYMTSAPVLVVVLEGPSAVSVVRMMVGATNPFEAQPGTIRGDYALSKTENIIHASDSVASAQREIKLFFDNVA